MTVEVLFSEVCNYFGDPQNAEYLKQSCPDADFIYTTFDSEPYFANNEPDFIIMGSMSEDRQRKVIDKLLPYKDRIEKLCEMGKVMLFTGNAADVFCRNIEYVTEGKKTLGLGLFDIDVKIDWFKRVNAKLIGDSDGTLITGFRSQFSEYFGDNSSFAFIKCERGFGLKKDSVFEGMRKNNLICTQLLGPVLPLNPDFCNKLIELAGGNGKAAFYEEAKAAYEKRVEEFRNPSTAF